MNNLFLFLVILLKASPIFTTMTFRNVIFESESMDSSNSTNENSIMNSKVADVLLEGFLSSGGTGRDKSASCLSSTLTKRLHSLNSFSETDESDIEERYFEDKFTLTIEEVGIIREFKTFLNDLKCPFQDHLNETLLVYKIQSNPHINVGDSENVLDYTLKAMILSLKLNQPEIFLRLISYFDIKCNEIQKNDYVDENILFDFIILTLFKQETKFSTFAFVLNNFLDFLSLRKQSPIEVEMKKFLEISGKEPKDKEIVEKIDFFIETIIMKISYFPLEPIDETGKSFLSIYFKYLYRTGKYMKALNFLFELSTSGSKLSIDDSYFMLLVATEYNSIEMFEAILKVSISDFSLIFSSQLILNRMKISLINFVPKITEIHLNPDKFLLKPNFISVLLEILLAKSSFEEIIAYFISRQLFLQLEIILSSKSTQSQSQSINFEQISLYLNLTESDWLKLIFISLQFTNFYSFVSELLKQSFPDLDLNYLILKSLSNLPATFYTSWAIDSIVSLSSGGPNHLLNLALRCHAKDVIELLCAFYKFESNAELLRNSEAAERKIVFINIDGFEFVQIFDQYNNSFELIIP